MTTVALTTVALTTIALTTVALTNVALTNVALTTVTLTTVVLTTAATEVRDPSNEDHLFVSDSSDSEEEQDEVDDPIDSERLNNAPLGLFGEAEDGAGEFNRKETRYQKNSVLLGRRLRGWRGRQ